MTKREHGTRACYVHGPDGVADGSGCRCDPCRAANAAAARERNQSVAPAYVGAAETRAHVRWLSEHGVGLKQIVKVSGVAQGTLWKLMYGKGGRPSKRIKVETRNRILAVQPSDAADGAKISAAPTHANIAELLDRGWTKAAIARAIGQSDTALQVGRKQVTVGNARAITALLDQPVPPRRSRFGLHPVAQPEVDDAEDVTPADIEETFRPFLFEPEPWREQSACRLPNVPLWIFFPGRGDLEATNAALAVCDTCPVKSDCLDAHLHERFGVWGGTTENQRREIRRERGLEDDQEAEVA